MIAFPRFKEIEQLPDLPKRHREWLKDYTGKKYGKGLNGKMNKGEEWTKTKYSDEEFSTDINCVGRLGNRLVIEFDGDPTKAKEYLDEVELKLKEKGWGYIRSTHNGKSDYLWVEFTRNITKNEAEKFLYSMAPIGSEVDLNFASLKKIFPVLYAVHHKHSNYREMPVTFFEGEQINPDELKVKYLEKPLKQDNEGYITSIRNEGDTGTVFTRRGQAEQFIKQQPLFYDKAGIWWFWDKQETKWELVDEVDILNHVFKTMNVDTIDSKSKTEIINALKQVGRLQNPKPIKKTWVQFKDKIYDIKTGEFFQATSEYFVTNPIPYEISGDARTPIMDAIFEQWVGKENVQTLHEIIAYCLLSDYPLHRIFCFVGSGLNGKGSFLRLLEKFLGKDNICSTELDTLISSRFEVTRLHKKLACVMGETNFSELQKTSMLKKLSGGDLIGFEYKNKNPFEDFNYAKIIISTNNLPTTSDKTIGFYRRWMIIDFPHQFSEKKEILETIPEEEYKNLATMSLIRLNEILEKREFHNEGTIEERRERYEAKSNFLERFLSLFTTQNDPNGYITKADFYKKFTAWGKENRFREMSETTVGLAMKKLGIDSARKDFNWMNDGKGGQARVWLGIKWKD